MGTHSCRSTTMVAVASSLPKEGVVVVAVIVDTGAVLMEDGVAKRDLEDVCLYLLRRRSALHNIC